MDQRAPHCLGTPLGVSPAAHLLAELHADGGPIAALAAEEAAPLPVTAGGIGTQLAPTPACRHKAEAALLQTTFTLNTQSHRMAWKGT